jgi:hypothetical protein
MVRVVLVATLVGAAGGLALWWLLSVAAPGQPSQDPVQRFARWEACVLNGNYDPSQAAQFCGPQPVP